MVLAAHGVNGLAYCQEFDNISVCSQLAGAKEDVTQNFTIWCMR